MYCKNTCHAAFAFWQSASESCLRHIFSRLIYPRKYHCTKRSQRKQIQKRYCDCAALATPQRTGSTILFAACRGANSELRSAGKDCGNKAYFLRKCAREQICRIEILWNEINAALLLLHRSSKKHPPTHLQRPDDVYTNAFFLLLPGGSILLCDLRQPCRRESSQSM